MGTLLVIGEHLDGKLASATLSTVAFARQAAEIEDLDIVGVLLGSGASAVAEEFAKYVPKVVYVDGAGFENYLAEAYAPAIAEIAEELDAEIVATPATTVGKDFLPRVAARLDAGFIADVIEVYEDDDEAQIASKRPIWAGNLIQLVTRDADVTCVTVRGTGFDAAAPDAGGSVDAKSADGAQDLTTFVKFDQVKSDRPALTDADVVISGGRGLKSADAFGMIEELADTLGGAVGASRAAVDSGYAPNDWQVGQTGKIVAPNLYVAIAISGAIQHLAGMKGSKTIVAINKDPEAPIFQLADYGLVADAFDVVPKLTEKLKAAKG